VSRRNSALRVDDDDDDDLFAVKYKDYGEEYRRQALAYNEDVVEPAYRKWLQRRTRY